MTMTWENTIIIMITMITIIPTVVDLMPIILMILQLGTNQECSVTNTRNSRVVLVETTSRNTKTRLLNNVRKFATEPMVAKVLSISLQAVKDLSATFTNQEIANLNQVLTWKAVTTNITKSSSGEKMNMTALMINRTFGIN